MRQAGVRLGAGVEDSDAVERRAGADRIDDRRTATRTSSSASEASTMRVRSVTTTAPAVVVGGLCGRCRGAGPRRDLGVGARVAGVPARTVVSARGATARADRPVLRQPLREVDDDGPSRRRRCPSRAPRRPRSSGPARRTNRARAGRARRGAAARRRPRAALRRDRVEAGSGHLAELAVRRDERGLRGGMLGDGRNRPGLVGERGADRGGDAPASRRADARRGEARRAEQLRQPVGRDERDRGQPAPRRHTGPERARGEEPAGRRRRRGSRAPRR